MRVLTAAGKRHHSDQTGHSLSDTIRLSKQGRSTLSLCTLAGKKQQLIKSLVIKHCAMATNSRLLPLNTTLGASSIKQKFLPPLLVRSSVSHLTESNAVSYGSHNKH
jgi:hypothetical protein